MVCNVCIGYVSSFNHKYYTYWYNVMVDDLSLDKQSVYNTVKRLFDDEINVPYDIHCIYSIDLHNATETHCIYSNDEISIDDYIDAIENNRCEKM